MVTRSRRKDLLSERQQLVKRINEQLIHETHYEIATEVTRLMKLLGREITGDEAIALTLIACENVCYYETE